MSSTGLQEELGGFSTLNALRPDAPPRQKSPRSSLLGRCTPGSGGPAGGQCLGSKARRHGPQCQPGAEFECRLIPVPHVPSPRPPMNGPGSIAQEARANLSAERCKSCGSVPEWEVGPLWNCRANPARLLLFGKFWRKGRGTFSAMRDTTTFNLFACCGREMMRQSASQGPFRICAFHGYINSSEPAQRPRITVQCSFRPSPCYSESGWPVCRFWHKLRRLRQVRPRPRASGGSRK